MPRVSSSKPIPTPALRAYRSKSIVRLPYPPGSKRRAKPVYIDHPPASPEARDEHRRIVGEWFANGCSPVEEVPAEVEPAGATVADLCAAVWNIVERDWRTPAGKLRAEAVRVFDAIDASLRQFDDLPADEFGQPKLRKIVNQLRDGTRATYTINKRIAVIVRIFELGHGEELCSAETVTKLVAAKKVLRVNDRTPGVKATKNVKGVEHDRVDATVAGLPRNAAGLVECIRHTGARHKELAFLKVGEVNRDGPIWFTDRLDHKTAWKGQKRRIYFNAKAQAILAPFLDGKADDELVFSRAADAAEKHESRRTPLGHGNRPGYSRNRRNGGPTRDLATHYTAPALRQAIHRAAKAAGVEPWHVHQLRHTAAADLKRTVGVNVGKTLLGQKTDAIFHGYAEDEKRDHADAVAALSDLGGNGKAVAA